MNNDQDACRCFDETTEPCSEHRGMPPKNPHREKQLALAKRQRRLYTLIKQHVESAEECPHKLSCQALRLWIKSNA